MYVPNGKLSTVGVKINVPGFLVIPPRTIPIALMVLMLTDGGKENEMLTSVAVSYEPLIACLTIHEKCNSSFIK